MDGRLFLGIRWCCFVRLLRVIVELIGRGVAKLVVEEVVCCRVVAVVLYVAWGRRWGGL